MASDAGWSEQLDDLTRRIARAREGGGLTPETAVLLQDLETAHDELRVADEEVRTQQEQVKRLLTSQRLQRWQHERMLAALPVAVLTTDKNGLIRSGNAAAAQLLNVAFHRLVPKPMFAFVHDNDRRGLREMLASVTRNGGTTRRAVTLLPRRQDPRSVDLFASVTSTPETGIAVTWLVASEPGVAGEMTGQTVEGLPETLLALTALTGTTNARTLAQQVADTCQRTLVGVGVGVGVVVGPACTPEAVAANTASARAVLDAQREVGEGPSVDAQAQLRVITAHDLRADHRWEALRGRLENVEIGSVVAAPVNGPDGVAGSLLMCATPGEALPLRSATMCELLAGAMSGLLQELGLHDELRNLASDMQRALASRAIIDQAKGIVMADKKVTAEAAFAHLVELSSALHLKLREVARLLVEDASGHPSPPE